MSNLIMPSPEVNPQERKVHRICQNVIPYFIDTFFTRYISDYKIYLWYKWDRAKQIEKWMSNTTIPITAAVVDTMVASMYDSKMKFNLNWWIEGQDILLNKAFDYNNESREILLDVIKEAIITWKGFTKPIFNLSVEPILINGVNYWKTKKRPEMKYISVFDMFYDYNNKLSDSTFHIERSILSQEQIFDRYISKLMPKGKEKNLELIQGIRSKIESVCNKQQQRYSWYDFSRVKHLLSYESIIVKRQMETNVTWQTVWQRNLAERSTRQGINDADWGSSIEYQNNIFWVDFKKNNKYEVIEYVDKDWITIMIDWNMLVYKKGYDILNKVYDVSFGAMPGSSDSTWICSNVWDIQKQINTLQNIFLDGLKMDAAPMYEQVWGINQLLWNTNRIAYDPFKIIATTQAWSLKKIELWLGWFEPANATQMLEWFLEKRVWVNEYIIWWQGKVERVSGWVDLIFNQYKSKLMPITNSIQQMMWRIAKSFLIMYAKYYTPQELKDLWLSWELDIAKLINEDWITFQLTSLALLNKEEWIKWLLDNLWPILNFAWGVESPNIDAKELLRQILNRDIDLDKLIPKDAPQQQYNQQGGQPQQGYVVPRTDGKYPDGRDFAQRQSLNELASKAEF